MRHRRVARGVVVSSVVVLLLTSCTPPSEYGVRLNADDTIDFVLCTGFYGDGDLTVDYRRHEEDVDEPEWVIASDQKRLLARQVISYGIAPAMSTTVQLQDPPTDWVAVAFGGEYMERSELVPGEWLWSTDPYPWIPDQPCITVTPLPERP